METAAKPIPQDGSEFPVVSASGDRTTDPHAEYIDAQIERYSNKLLGMTLPNHLLNCPHDPRVQAQVRVVDELPEIVFERLAVDGKFTFLPLLEPRDQPDDENSHEFVETLGCHKQESAIYKAAIEQVLTQREKNAGLERVEWDGSRPHVRLRPSMGVWACAWKIFVAGAEKVVAMR